MMNANLKWQYIDPYQIKSKELITNFNVFRVEQFVLDVSFEQ